MLRVEAWIGASLLFFATTAFADDKPKGSVANVALIKIKGALAETPIPAGIFGEGMENLRSFLDRIQKAADDDKIRALYLEIDAGFGRGQLNEIRSAILKFKKSGKKVVASMEDFGASGYLAATAADEIVLPPSGSVMLTGIRMEFSYYKDLFDRLNIHVDTMQMGDFKGAGEPFSRSAMSEPLRKQMTLLIDDLYDQMVSMIAEGRKKTPEEVRRLIDEGPYTAEAALKAGLVDRLEYAGDFKTRIAKQLKVDSVTLKVNYGKKAKHETDFENPFAFMKILSELAGNSNSTSKSSKQKIALLHAVGMIGTGKGEGGLFSAESIGSDTFVEAIRKIAKDKKVKAVVIRVDSPGGSALASDLIWQELGKVGKPVIVSMGDVAASGGYYISMGADKIFAEPGTITGSIGVISIKPALNGLYQKFGINTETISRGKNSGIMSDRPWTDSERAAFLKISQDIYGQFTSKAARGRRMDLEKLLSLAGGRVWTGRQAKENGLVDELGTLNDALAYAKKVAKLDSGESVDIESLPKPTNPFESLFGVNDENSPGDARLLKALAPDLSKRFQALAWMRAMMKEGTFAVMPFHMDVK